MKAIRVARHGGPDVDPDSPDRAVDPVYREEVRRFLHGHVPALAEAPIGHEEVCLYTVAPGEHFLADLWPGRRDVVVASPCSGHGFKFSNLLGRLLAELALDGRSDLADEAWRIALDP